MRAVRRRVLGLIVLLAAGVVASISGAHEAAPAPAASTPGAAPAASGDAPPREPRPSQAAVLAANTVARLDQAYGTDPKQTLDIYMPRDAKDAPAVIFVHGGEWMRGDKSNVSFKPKFLNEHGIVFVSVNYRLSPAVTHPAHASDVASAVRWVRDHAAEMGADPGKLVLMGHSAGCHLAALTGLDPEHLGTVKLAPTDLKGVVAWSGGAYDLVEKVKGEGIYSQAIRQAFGETEAALEKASPMTYPGAAPMPRFLFVSVERGNPSHTAAERLGGKIREAGGDAENHVLPDRTHFTANHLLGAPDDTTGTLLVEFVERVTR